MDVRRRDSGYNGQRMCNRELPGRRKRGGIQRRFMDVVKDEGWCDRRRCW